MDTFVKFFHFTGFYNVEIKFLIMIVIGIVFIILAIKKEYEPLLLLPIGFGMLVGNIPMAMGLKVGVYEAGSVLNILYQ